ncbi:glycosyltransferase family A protein [Rhizobium sp. 57MFTsu3.2]|uniref:glycosyltransferase n=1 Tax=Rhizobium sp. 57MFTsu3.2 TaxID=1048681 RepID=UPI00146C8B15|nr:glycosyltransferase family A protein [Rhizobium sp. 57MFTsu3.2]NMN73136.1 Glycosyltransferases, probably involved in cell wall biogenesis [Rhizobium sp. 57MFTsu3.2]
MGCNFQLSVVIPHLNEPGNLRACLEALDLQRTSAVRMEIIVVDNGSHEMPFDVCSGLSDVRLVRQPIPGPGPARNLGASLATSDLIAFIDADCVVQPGWANAILSLMAARPDVDIVGGDIGILRKDASTPTGIEAYEELFSYRARLYVEKHSYTATGNMAVRSGVFHTVGPFGGITTMEDTEWGQRAAARGFRIAFLEEARVLTPSCTSFSELARRWDRHVAHAFGDVRRGKSSLMRWLALTLLVAASPLGEVQKVLTSRRIVGARSRAIAFVWLTRVRLYRARKMAALSLSGKASALVDGWNREADM